MSLRKLPEIRADISVGGVSFDIREDALERWTPEIRASSEDVNSISILDPIGQSMDGTGVTAKRVGAALRAMGKNDVTVNVNSPGGDFFEGVAIYNMLRDHPGKVTVRVMGLAASAASVIAMAADELQMGDGAFLMIHNAWALAVGNRHDMRAAADQLEPFDQAMANVYAARTGLPVKRVQQMMDAETWINSQTAVAEGWADGVVGADAVTIDASASQKNRKALALVESAMVKAGYSRSDRRETLHALFSDKPGAVGNDAKPGAGDDIAALLHTTIQTLKGI